MDIEPRIYVACLASYNAGILYGRWIDATTDIAAMNEAIQEMLAGSPQPNVMRQRYRDEGELRFVDVSTPSDRIPEEWEKEGEPFASAEEWAIHDYEGLGPNLGEYAGLQEVARRVEIVEAADDAGLPAAVLLEAMEDEPADSDPADFVSDRYRGTADSWADFALELTEETNDMSAVPEWLQNHIDWESIGRDFRLSGDFFAIEHAGDTYFFWAH